MNLPDFERDRWMGQMNPAERALLYNMTISAKPEIAVEVGTCRGGGSTYFISRGLFDNQKGKLYTCENKKEFYDEARKLFSENPDFLGLENHVDFTFGNALDMISKINGNIDLCLLDGGADRLSIVYEFALFRPLIPVGKYLFIHDWDEKDYEKCRFIRPMLMEDTDWRMIYRALELVVFQRVADTHWGNS
jgi:predicted O-methyltransferase YrrM